MRALDYSKIILGISLLAAAPLIWPPRALAQDQSGSSAPQNTQTPDLVSVNNLVQRLQSQVQELSGLVENLRVQQESSRAEAAELRRQLDAAKSQLSALAVQPAGAPSPPAPSSTAGQAAAEDRIAKLEEYQQMADAKVSEENQTKIESSSKYRVRLSGMVLFNTYINRGSVDNQDVPTLATEPGAFSSGGTFGGSLRQSQIGLQGFGPTIAGARTSADVHFDFAGGFPDTPNGISFGIMRLRTGTIRFDWGDTSIIAGQDSLFLAPSSPTSLATIALPAFAYSGNLWSWTPQVRIEHRFALAETSSFLLQGGVLDSLSGDKPFTEYTRSFTWGENSGQPAYAIRLSWNQSLRGQTMTFGAGGYYGRQDWGFGRSIDSWAGTLDATVPLGSRFEFAGQFYRGRATGGLGGGIAQSVLWQGSFISPLTQLYGLDSMGGWSQLKYRATSKLQFNGAFGQDNPFAGELRQFGGNQTYYSVPLSKNLTAMGNFLYQPKSDIVLSLEYRRLKTYTLDSYANTANVITMSVGYLF